MPTGCLLFKEKDPESIVNKENDNDKLSNESF